MRAIHDTEFPNSVESTQKLLDEQGIDYEKLKVSNFRADAKSTLLYLIIVLHRMIYWQPQNMVNNYWKILSQMQPKSYPNEAAT